MEYIKELWKEHWILLASITALVAFFSGLFIIPYDVGWYTIPIVGTSASLGLVIFGLYHTCAANYSNSYASLEPQRGLSYKAKLRDLRRQRRKAQRKVYSYKGLYSQTEYINKLRKVESEIAKHTGTSDER